MSSFAERTGLTSARPAVRYLWTDAFAVCNFIGLGDSALARRLVDQVHHTLGRYRSDDARTGWLGDASEAHPTRGGLRIGKKLPERREAEPFDEELEWDRDGQYFHYLTKWMHALHQANLDAWARELASAAHRAFVHDGRMVWKMSTDLSRPLVSSMGQHDPLDGYLTYVEIEADERAIADFRAMTKRASLVTTDPLGLGGLLVDASRAAQLPSAAWLLDDLLRAAAVGLSHWVNEGALESPASHRLAFRELGLAIGLRALELMEAPRALARFLPLADAIETFWAAASNQRARAWVEHRDIDEVMLATCMTPKAFLVLRPSSCA